MELAQLLTQANISFDEIPSAEVSGMTFDSRQVKSGDIFLAIKGHSLDGRKYMASAIEKGASFVLYEAEGAEAYAECIPVNGLAVRALPRYVQGLAEALWPDPDHFTITGITGTNGKSTIAWFLALAYEALGVSSAVSGTLGTGPVNNLTVTGNTTADLPTLRQNMASLADIGVKQLALEVSSHGLVQGRVDGIPIQAGVFTNLTQDHLDYHGTMEAYGEAKALLFEMTSLKKAVINVDDPFGEKLAERLDQEAVKEVIRISSKPLPTNDIYVISEECTEKGIQADVITPWGEGRFGLNVYGRYNLMNALSVIALLGGQWPLKEILKVMEVLIPPPGRMEAVKAEKGPVVLIDYAHTPDAVRSTLLAVREHFTTGRVGCVIGCGGDRDRTKRPLMAEAACLADQVWLTSDNPRSEAPEAILDDMRSGVPEGADCEVVMDRKEAIFQAISKMTEKDVLVVAGKGHETYQEINGIKHPFSDYDVAKKALGGIQS